MFENLKMSDENEDMVIWNLQMIRKNTQVKEVV